MKKRFIRGGVSKTFDRCPSFHSLAMRCPLKFYIPYVDVMCITLRIALMCSVYCCSWTLDAKNLLCSIRACSVFCPPVPTGLHRWLCFCSATDRNRKRSPVARKSSSDTQMSSMPTFTCISKSHAVFLTVFILFVFS